MSILRVEHPVLDYAVWKRAFDSEPISRKASGVHRYQVMRAVDDPNYVMIDLEFDTTIAAESFLTALRELWSRGGGDR